MPHLLVVDDNQRLLQDISEYFTFKGYSVVTVTNGGDAKEFLTDDLFDVIILDWDIPEEDGITVCSWFRRTGGTAPIIMLTGKAQVQDKELGFEVGADDYLTKPFHMRELEARVKGLLRRSPALSSQSFSVGAVRLDPSSKVVTVGGSEVKLQKQEFALLEFFMRNPGRVFSPDAILRRVWPQDDSISTDAVYTCIRRIRQKLKGSELIDNVHGVGYRLTARPDEERGTMRQD